MYEKENKKDKNLPHPRPPDDKHGGAWEEGAGSDDLLDAAEVGGHQEGGDGGEEASQGEPELGRERLKKRQPVPVLSWKLDEEPAGGSFFRTRSNLEDLTYRQGQRMAKFS